MRRLGTPVLTGLLKRGAVDEVNNAAVSATDLGLSQGRTGDVFHVLVIGGFAVLGHREADTYANGNDLFLVIKNGLFHSGTNALAQYLGPFKIGFRGDNFKFLAADPAHEVHVTERA